MNYSWYYSHGGKIIKTNHHGWCHFQQDQDKIQKMGNKRCGTKASYHSYVASYGNNVHGCTSLLHIPTTTFQRTQQRLKQHLLQAYQQMAKQTCPAHPNGRHHRSGSQTLQNKWTQSDHMSQPEGRDQHWCHKVGYSTEYTQTSLQMSKTKGSPLDGWCQVSMPGDHLAENHTTLYGTHVCLVLICLYL